MSKTAKLYLKNGEVEYPKEWIALHDVDGEDKDCPYAGVVEVRNGHLYKAPTFIFPTSKKKARNYNAEMIKNIMEACIKSYPGFDHILEMEPCRECLENIDWNNGSDVLRVREIMMKLPEVNLFCIPVVGDPEFNGTYDPEIDVVIIKNETFTPVA